MNPKEKSERAAQVARLYYIQNRSQKEIARELNLENASSVSRLLKYARNQGIVKVEIQPVTRETPKRNQALEAELLRSFDFLNAIVVEDVGYEGPFSPDKDEKLHSQLSKALAEELRSMIRSGDHIGVTGGRGTYYTAVALRTVSLPRLKQSGVKISSLSGNVSSIAWTERMPVDADDVAYHFSCAFASAILRRLSLPVAVASRQALDEFLEKGQGIAISPEKWRKDKTLVPDIAIVGIGALDISGPHRFLDLDGYELQPIKSELWKLIEMIKTFPYCPVGDIGYRLFYIEPPSTDIHIPAHRINALQNKINTINNRILSINSDQLRMIDVVVAVAGGPLKVNAIWQVLKNSEQGPLIQELCTDDRTAQALIKRFKKSERKA